MATMTIRNIPDDVYRLLKVRAALNDRSAEAEVRAMIQSATSSEGGIDEGEALLAIGRQVGLTDAEHALFARDKSAPRKTSLP